jgi:hypothetical protein
MSFRRLKRILTSGETLSEAVVVSVEEVKPKRKTISENELLEEVDPETKVFVALKASLRSIRNGQYIRDSDLRRECHANDTTLWREVRCKQEFWPNVMIVGNSAEPMIYWGSPTSVASLVQRGKARKPQWVRKEKV